MTAPCPKHELIRARRALKGVHADRLGNALDRLCSIYEKVKSHDEPLGRFIARLNHDFLVPISLASGNWEIRFDPPMKQQVDAFTKRMTEIMDASSLSKSWFSLKGEKHEVEKISRLLSAALDDLQVTESMNATIVRDPMKTTVLIRKDVAALLPKCTSLDSQDDVELGSDQPETVLNLTHQFRILVLGKAGAGKSTLINCVFRFNDADVSDFCPRQQPDIDTEIKSTSNPQVILHDSRGFELGERENMKTLKDFIRNRNMKPEAKDKLHAIWLCIETPFAGSRVFEAGDLEFLNVDLGVPVIVVYTKYDLLELAIETALEEDSACELDLDDTELGIHIADAAKREYRKRCVEPLMRIPGGEGLLVHHTSVSKNDRDSLMALSQRTAELCRERLSEAAWLAYVMVQRIDLNLKLEATMLLHQDDFRLKVFLLTQSLKPPTHVPQPTPPAVKLVVKALSYAAGSVPIVGSTIAPVVELAANIVASIYGAVKSTLITERAMMAYIINLTAILKGLFQSLHSEPLGSRPVVTVVSIDTVVGEFECSEDRVQCHREIEESVAHASSFLSIGHRRKRLQEIVRLIETYILHRGIQHGVRRDRS
ncbi:hypothetical protein FRB94_002683 [Tulasnella sp. JGI-2019a]|nr:hypothetical protein FRB94_002683 [Tulasnella sp. JGI-2019a]